MADLLFPDEGLTYQLEQILSPGVTFHLFTNNYVPTLNTTLADLVEAAWSGYASVNQSWSDFTINGVSGHNGYAIAPPISFSNTSGAPQNFYGYFITDTGASLLIAVLLFDGSPLTIADGSSYQVTPVFGDLSAETS